MIATSAVGDPEVAPAARLGRCGRGYLVARENAVHLAHLREGEQALPVQMREEMVTAFQPETLFKLEELVL